MAIVRYKSSEIPPTTQEDIDRIRAIKDEDIDYSDIPKLTEDFWKNAMPVKELHAFCYGQDKERDCQNKIKI